MQIQPSFYLPAIQISNTYRYFEKLKNSVEGDPRFLKILNKLYLHIQEVATFLSAPLEQIKAKGSAEDYTAEELQILKLTKNMLAASSHFDHLACENPLVKTIQLILGTWKKYFLGSAVRRPIAALPIAKRMRLTDAPLSFSFSNLPNEIVTIICSYASWMTPLSLMCTNKRLYTIYSMDQSQFMIGMRLVNQALNQCKRIVGDVDFSSLDSLGFYDRLVLTLPSRLILPTDLVFKCSSKGFYKALEQGDANLAPIMRYIEYLCRFATSGARDCFIKELFHSLFPEAILERNVPIAATFETLAFKLKQKGLPVTVDFKTRLLIEFITKLDLSVASADMHWLAWQLLEKTIDLTTVPHKKALLASLLALGGSCTYFPVSQALQMEIMVATASKKKSTKQEIESLDLNQALIQAYVSCPENKLPAFEQIFQLHQLGEWTLNLNQIHQMLASWWGDDVILMNDHAYLNGCDLEDSYVVAYCKMAEPLLQILSEELDDRNQNKIKKLVHKICEDIRKLLEIDLKMYEDADTDSAHGFYEVPCNFGSVLKLIDKLGFKESADLFERLKAVLAYIPEDRYIEWKKTHFVFSILAWQSDQIYTFLDELCKGSEGWCALVIEQYAEYNALLALQLAYKYCQTSQTLLDLMAAILPKLDINAANEAAAIKEATEFLKSALETHTELDPTQFILHLASFNPKIAMQFALSLKDINRKAFCGLKIAQANLSTFAHTAFYQQPLVIKALTEAATSSQTLINQHVFNFIFKLSNSVEDFSHFIRNRIYGSHSVIAQVFGNSPSWIDMIESLYSALVEAGMPSQILLEVVREESAALLDTNDRKLELFSWLLRKGNKLMHKDVPYASNRND